MKLDIIIFIACITKGTLSISNIRQGKDILSHKLSLFLSKWILAFSHVGRRGRLSADNYLN